MFIPPAKACCVYLLILRTKEPIAVHLLDPFSGCLNSAGLSSTRTHTILPRERPTPSLSLHLVPVHAVHTTGELRPSLPTLYTRPRIIPLSASFPNHLPHYHPLPSGSVRDPFACLFSHLVSSARACAPSSGLHLSYNAFVVSGFHCFPSYARFAFITDICTRTRERAHAPYRAPF